MTVWDQAMRDLFATELWQVGMDPSVAAGAITYVPPSEAGTEGANEVKTEEISGGEG